MSIVNVDMVDFIWPKGAFILMGEDEDEGTVVFTFVTKEEEPIHIALTKASALKFFNNLRDMLKGH